MSITLRYVAQQRRGEETREHLLDVAEQLFGERGVASVSLREIRLASGARNTAAIQFHFGDREGLMDALIARHVPRIGERQQTLWDAIVFDGAENDPARLVDVFVRPLAEYLALGPSERSWVKIMGELAAAPDVPLNEMVPVTPAAGIESGRALFRQMKAQLPERSRANGSSCGRASSSTCGRRARFEDDPEAKRRSVPGAVHAELDRHAVRCALRGVDAARVRGKKGSRKKLEKHVTYENSRHWLSTRLPSRPMWGTRGFIAGLASCALVATVFSGTAGATTTQSVHSLTVGNWFAVNEGPAGSVGSAELVTGPPTAPLGLGSAKLTVDSNGRASLGTLQFAGTRPRPDPGDGLLGERDRFFDTDRAPVRHRLQLDRREHRVPRPVDVLRVRGLDAGCVARSRRPQRRAVVGERRARQHAVQPDHDVHLVAGAGQLAGRRGALRPGCQGRVHLPPRRPGSRGTTAYVDAAHPHDRRRHDGVDFEPGATITPAVGFAGSPVTITAYNLKPKSAMVANYQIALNGRRLKLVQRQGGRGAGKATCTAAIPVAKKAGEFGVHDIKIQGRTPSPKSKRLELHLDYFLTP